MNHRPEIGAAAGPLEPVAPLTQQKFFTTLKETPMQGAAIEKLAADIIRIVRPAQAAVDAVAKEMEGYGWNLTIENKEIAELVVSGASQKIVDRVNSLVARTWAEALAYFINNLEVEIGWDRNAKTGARVYVSIGDLDDPDIWCLIEKLRPEFLRTSEATGGFISVKDLVSEPVDYLDDLCQQNVTDGIAKFSAYAANLKPSG